MKRNLKENLKLILLVGGMLIGLVLCVICICASISRSEPACCPQVDAQQPIEYDVKQLKATTLKAVEKPSYTDEELFYMAAAIYNEAGGDACSDDTRRLVGYVILNRVNDSRFPNTIKGVLEQRSQYGRFHWTGIKFADRASLPQEKNAVDRAYRIAKEVLETDIIPIPHTVVFQAEFLQGVSLYAYQDGIYFCHAKEVR